MRSRAPPADGLGDQRGGACGRGRAAHVVVGGEREHQRAVRDRRAALDAVEGDHRQPELRGARHLRVPRQPAQHDQVRGLRRRGPRQADEVELAVELHAVLVLAGHHPGDAAPPRARPPPAARPPRCRAPASAARSRGGAPGRPRTARCCASRPPTWPPGRAAGARPARSPRPPRRPRRSGTARSAPAPPGRPRPARRARMSTIPACGTCSTPASAASTAAVRASGRTEWTRTTRCSRTAAGTRGPPRRASPCRGRRAS